MFSNSTHSLPSPPSSQSRTSVRTRTRTCASTAISFVILCLVANLFDVIVVVDCCDISEYQCDNKQCIQLDGYCNGVKQCRDGSDERSGCSPCNRTYYGLETFTYKLSLHSPSVCTFTFIAAGAGRYGDIIQLSLPLDPPQVPKSHLSTSPFATATTNCTSTLTLSEPNQIARFCLSTSFNSSKVNYYSNSNKITVTFTHNIEIVYRFLANVISTKGVLLQGTICSILYENCARTPSALFNRNVHLGKYGTSTSYMTPSSSSSLGYNNYQYTDHSLTSNAANMNEIDMTTISGSNNCIVRSPNYPGVIASNISCYYAFREPPGSLIHIQGSVRLSEDCESYLVVYDGYSIRDQVLGKYCGEINVDVVSGGNEMLVEFYSGKSGLWQYRGLQLEATSISSTLSTPCSTTISSLISMSGILATPLSGLGNTSKCTYNFQGTGKQLIWFMFQQFHGGNDSTDGGELVFTDGSRSITYSNSTPPPLCELLYMPLHRPCKKESESILSRTNAVSITLNLPKPLFKLQYVFIEPSNCGRIYTTSNGHLSSTKHLFDFGAGGTKNLRCSYEFNENIRLVIKDANFEGSCKIVIDEVTARTKCKYSTSRRAQHIRLELPLILTSNYKSRLTLVGVNMGRDISPENSYFSGTFSKLGTPPCTNTHYLQVSTKSSFPYYSSCETFLLLLPKPSIYIKLDGCAIVHTDYDFNYMCNNEIFAPGFKNSTLTNNMYVELTSSLTINYVQVFNPHEPNYNYVSGEPSYGENGLVSGIGGAVHEELISDTCGGFKCTSINACIHKELFCNGNINCPNAEDEACSHIDYTYLYIFIAGVLGAGFIFLLCTGFRKSKVVRTSRSRKGVG